MSLALRTLQHLALAARGVPPPPFQDARHNTDNGSPPWAGKFDNNNKDMQFDGKDVHSEETILFLFLSFGILIVLILILLLLSFQTYLSWRIAGVLVEAGDEEGGGRGAKGLRAWRKGEKERKRALKMLEKRRSGVSVRRVGDEELGMTGARGSSLVLDRMKVVEGKKKGFWKRWF
jgi:hypothetical protein